jgi:DNA repair photolyase
MKIREIKTKSVVVKSNLPDTDYVINPYIGCTHKCIYCYASFMKRFTNHHERWGDFIDIKINAVDTLRNTEKLRGKKILMSSVTDPYNPLEKKYKLTRRILEALIPVQPKLEILTKSRIASRDIDLLKQYKDVTVGISLSTLDNEISKELEPYASPPDVRIDTLRKCNEAGLKTYVFISPILPFITNIEEILDKTKFVDFFMFENLNIRPTNRKEIFDFIKENRPNLVDKYKEIYDCKNNYWNNLEKQIKELCKERGKEARIYFHHGGF